MEPAEPLSEKPVLDDAELKDEPIILEHHSMLTPSDYNFSALRNTTQNFQFRGYLWLTDHRLIYKGYFITDMGASKVSERLMKPYCNVDSGQPFIFIIPLENVSDLFIGHDSTFQKRFQRYPKLRLQFKSNGDMRTFYFYLTRENLIDDELYINKRCKEWLDKITEVKKKLIGAAPASPPIPVKPKGPALTPAPAPAAAPAVATVTKRPRIGTDGILKEAVDGVDKKRYGKTIVKPLEEREKPEFTTISKPVQSEDEEAEPEFTKLLDTLVPISDDEFSAAAADTSIARCPHCGWILGYATTKCPRCRKTI